MDTVNTPDTCLRRRERIAQKADYKRVYQKRCRAGDGTMLVYIDRNELSWSRLGLSVGRKCGRAVTRNRIRRRIREGFRLSKRELPVGLDIICVANAKVREPDYDVACALRTLTTRALQKLDHAAT